MNSFAYGGLGGYNFQIKNIVLGVEVNLVGLNLSDNTQKIGIYPCCSPSAFIVNQSVKSNWLFTALPRLGYTFGNFLVYGTGGYALTDISYKGVFNDTFATAHEDAGFRKNLNGWALGAGVEYRLTNHCSVRGAYVYTGFGGGGAVKTSNLTAYTPPIPFPTNTFTNSAALDNIQTINFSFIYRV